MSESKLLNGYELSRAWFDFCFENPDLIHPNHTAIFFFAIEHCNRMGWKKKFGFPTQMVMDAIGIKKYATYIKYFNDVCDWGFIGLVEKSKNQYSANIICLLHALPKNGKALDKAIVKHGVKQTQKQLESTGQSSSESEGQSNHKSKGSIDKPLTINQEPINTEPEGEEKKADEFLIPSMCRVWYEKFPHYTKNQDNDFPAMLKILQFMTTQAGQTNINDPAVKEMVLNTLEKIAEEVLKDQFWMNKGLNSIANNIQEFYNRIKNPQNGAYKQASSRQAVNSKSVDYLLQSIGNDIQRFGEQSDRA